MQKIFVFSDLDKKTRLNREVIRQRITSYKLEDEENLRKLKEIEEQQRQIMAAEAEEAAKMQAIQAEQQKKFKEQSNKNKLLLQEAKKLMGL